MRTQTMLCLAFCFSAGATGCGSSTTTDAGTPTDVVTVTDAGTATDTATPTDSITVLDAFTPTDAGPSTDTGTAADNGTTTDAGTGTDVVTPTDAGTPTDVVTPTDAGTPLMVIHGCSADMYVDNSAPAASRNIAFTFPTYTPKCMTIAAGQSVTFMGAFSGHPLSPGVAPGMSGTGTTPTPIVATSSGATATFTFAAPGLYPYYCVFHAGSGMTGVIQVR